MAFQVKCQVFFRQGFFYCHVAPVLKLRGEYVRPLYEYFAQEASGLIDGFLFWFEKFLVHMLKLDLDKVPRPSQERRLMAVEIS